jgi:ABC-type transport system involved in cytochrome bd biosynthesis fused ATPase/permease subunit
LDEGRIIETGTHERLMERRGLYYEMVERQRQSFGSDAEIVRDASPGIPYPRAPR